MYEYRISLSITIMRKFKSCRFSSLILVLKQRVSTKKKEIKDYHCDWKQIEKKCSAVEIFKRKQESKKTRKKKNSTKKAFKKKRKQGRKQELDQESDQEKKKVFFFFSLSFSCFLDRFLGRVLFFFLVFLL